MPKLEMNNATLKYCLYFLPLAGLLVGLAEVAWLILCVALGFSPVLFGAGACAVTFLVTGGIHMDGYADTSDALNSHAEVKKKHYILNDPHVGAFSVASSIIYILIMFAAFYEIYSMIGGLQGLWIMGSNGLGESAESRLRDFALSLGVIFIASRALTVLSAASIRTSKKEGMLYTFVIFTDKRYLAVSSLIIMILCCAVVIKLFSWQGLAFPAALFAVYLYFRIMAIHQFRGVSGDLCGWLVQVTELILLLILIVLFR